jgi:predicted TPR repeat methyltransferase
MTADLLQIALEHHRNGRLQQAEAIYRQLISEHAPQAGHASHWLGVLLLQAGQAAHALPLLERAIEAEPTDAAFRCNLGQAYLATGKLDAAVRTFSKASELDGQGRDIWLGLGTALLTRGKSADAPLAVQALQQAISIKADGPSLYLLGIAHRQSANNKEARKNLLKALEDEPEMAQGWFALASLDAAEGNHTQAMALLRRAIKIDPHFASAYEALAQILQQRGKSAEAKEMIELGKRAWVAKAQASGKATGVAELQRKVEANASDLPLHYALASLTHVTPPSNVPQAAVSGLFDKYADYFDEHLQGTLQYRAPELLAEAIKALQISRPLDICDIGCGTGICGPLLKPMAATMVGVDLSAGMIEKAKERGLYDRLETGDLVEFMRQHSGAFDLLIAADVLLYLGDLQPTFEAAVNCLRAGGYFAFTVEATGGDRYELRTKTRRYRHSQPYLEHLAKMFGFEQIRSDAIVLRKEALQPVPGYLMILQLPGAESAAK